MDHCSVLEMKDLKSSEGESCRGPCCVAGTSEQNLIQLWSLVAHWTETLQTSWITEDCSHETH